MSENNEAILSQIENTISEYLTGINMNDYLTLSTN